MRVQSNQCSHSEVSGMRFCGSKFESITFNTSRFMQSLALPTGNFCPLTHHCDGWRRHMCGPTSTPSAEYCYIAHCPNQLFMAPSFAMYRKRVLQAGQHPVRQTAPRCRCDQWVRRARSNGSTCESRNTVHHLISGRVYVEHRCTNH